MNTNISMVQNLQLQAERFLKGNYIVVNGISVYPKDIEIYYYKEK